MFMLPGPIFMLLSPSAYASCSIVGLQCRISQRHRASGLMRNDDCHEPLMSALGEFEQLLLPNT